MSVARSTNAIRRHMREAVFDDIDARARGVEVRAEGGAHPK
jgi:hypothetical protein